MDKAVLRKVQLFLFDMDGTLYIGNKMFDFTLELLKTIKDSGRAYRFMTNNSSKSVDSYIKKLASMGVESKREDFITSSMATINYLNEHYPSACLYVCGTASLKQEFYSCGFVITEDINATDCIVMGFDTELTFKKIEDICKMLLTRDIPYIATNPDYVCPTEYGSVPDCGSVCDMIYNATKKRPLVIGKPEPLMPRLAMEKLDVKPENTAVIGDRIYTDIRSGINADCLSVLVMSGETNDSILNSSDIKPDIVLESAKEIIDIIK